MESATIKRHEITPRIVEHLQAKYDEAVKRQDEFVAVELHHFRDLLNEAKKPH